MSFQESAIEGTRYAAAEAFRYAKKVPADKLNWKPMDAGRSVLELCQEMAQCASWTTQILQGGLQMGEEENPAGLDTVEACEAECNKNLEAMYAAIREFPEARLEEKYTLPFDGGAEITMRQNIMYPLWNFTYHQGQIGYIQTLYGDNNNYW